MWEDLLNFAKIIPVKFSFFVSGVYYLADDQKDKYINHNNESKLCIGFGGTRKAVSTRIKYTLQSLQDGHEIASHLNGHFNGVRWETATWHKEIEQFQRFLDESINCKARTVRFPLLAYNKNVYKPLIAHGYRSVLSHVDPMRGDTYTIYKDDQNRQLIIHPIARLKSKHYPTLSMDYDLWVHDQKYRPNRSTDEIAAYVYEAYLEEAAICKALNKPLIISHHFSTFNKGAYLDGLKKFLTTIQEQYPVNFLTVSALDNLIAAYHASNK